MWFQTQMQVTLNTEAKQHRILHQAISMKEFGRMDIDKNGAVDKMEYLCRTLIAQVGNVGWIHRVYYRAKYGAIHSRKHHKRS